MEMPPVRYAHARDGTRIAYTIIPGASPPWLHVYSLESAPGIELDLAIASRAGFIEELAGGRATVLYDVRGRGLSGPIRGELAIEDITDDLDSVCRAVGEPVDIFAINSGCFAACIGASRTPEYVRSLVLHIPSLTYGTSVAGIRPVDIVGNHRYSLGIFLRNMNDVPLDELDALTSRFERALPLATVVAYRNALKDVDLADVLPRIAVPTLVSPRLAEMLSPHALEVAHRTPGARLIVTEEGYHRPELGRQLRRLLAAEGFDAHIVSVNGRPTLSPRESDVLSLVAAGNSNAEIAAELVLSTRTVERHVQNIYNKLGVHNRVEAASWALRHRAE